MSTAAMASEKIYTRAEAAQKLGISTSTLKRIISEKRIGQFRTGKRKTHISERHINEYLRSVEQPANLSSLDTEQE